MADVLLFGAMGVRVASFAFQMSSSEKGLGPANCYDNNAATNCSSRTLQYDPNPFISIKLQSDAGLRYLFAPLGRERPTEPP